MRNGKGDLVKMRLSADAFDFTNSFTDNDKR